jgi:hypothetical protein
MLLTPLFMAPMLLLTF